MITDSKWNLLACPFSHACNLPKNHNTCGFPEYKMCPEHDQKLLKLKASVKILH